MDSYQIGDRRPLASRGWKTSERIARWLARRGITPNAISIAGMLCGIAAGIMFFETSRVSHPWIFWLSGAVLVQLRLLANLYDGMVAVLRQIASPVGELFNDVPGFVATIFAIFLAYLRAEGKVAGAHQEFCGPMAKQQRMATVTLVAIACAIVPGATDWQVPMFALWLIIAGCIVTAIRRLQRISATLRHR